ncbi:hypothetical protein BC831DRAFT_482584 [Entophlyctis helioformis]|nr:hypothetical protein BC831DRAFT_482584 [Entophlyctis helioformis]
MTASTSSFRDMPAPGATRSAGIRSRTKPWNSRSDAAAPILVRYFAEAGSIEELPTDIPGPDNKLAQEWDAVFKVSSTLYLCEAKLVMPLVQAKTQLSALHAVPSTCTKGCRRCRPS